VAEPSNRTLQASLHQRRAFACCAIRCAIKFLFSRINRLQASQNAAALLFDLGTVDIR